MRTLRILVTASRTWPSSSERVIWDELDRYLQWAIKNGAQVLVVHGGAAGGDRMAHRWARQRMAEGQPVLEPEVHPARWHDPCRSDCMPGHRRQDKPAPARPGPPTDWTICPMQGFYRNDYMVSLGADVCLAFVFNGSRGARQCALSARKAGIRTVRIERWSRGRP